MSTLTASALAPVVKAQFTKIGEQPPEIAPIETIARVVAGRLKLSLGTWPFPSGTVTDKTVAFFVEAYVKNEGPDAPTFATKVSWVLPNQFTQRDKPIPEPPYRLALERLTVGVLLTRSLPPPKAAPLAAAEEMVKFYLAGYQPS
jgi:hypothetical protein